MSIGASNPAPFRVEPFGSTASLSLSAFRSSRLRLFFWIFLLVGLSGCATQQSAAQRTFAPEPPAPVDAQSVVFCADGAGDFRYSSTSLRKTAKEDHERIDVRTYPWSHGHYRILADQTDYAHARVQGQHLAARIQAYHAEYPERKVHLWGHSAGAIVILAALEAVPCGIVENAVLLSPSLSAFYDVRPALAKVNGHLNVFYSQRDWLYLGVATAIVGTSDRKHGHAAGRYGFRILGDDPTDAHLYQHLVQHAWQPSDRDLGNKGNHYGGYSPDFIRANIMSILR